MINWRGDPVANQTADPAMYWLAYSDKGLHIAFRFDRPPHALTPKADGSPDSCWGDDIMEVLIRPIFGVEKEFDLVVNAKGIRADGIRQKSNNPAWNGEWSGAARTTDRGWEGEITVPWATMNVEKPKGGEMWEMLLLRNRKTPSNDVAVNSFIHLWHASQTEFGYVTFATPQQPSVRILQAGAINATQAGMTLELVGTKQAGKVNVQMALLTPKADASLEVDVNNLEGEVWVPRKEQLTFFDALQQLGVEKTLAQYEHAASFNKTIEVQADRAVRLPIQGQVSYGKHVLTYRVIDEATGKLIAGGAMPFVHRPYFDVNVKKYLLVAKGLKIEAGHRRMTNINKDCAVVADLIDPASKKVLSTVKLPVDLSAGRTLGILPVKNRFDVSYDIHTRMIDATGNTLAEDMRSMTMPAKPIWLDNQIGVVDMVLPGWEPLKLSSNDTAKVTLREYKFAKSGLPASITSRDKQLLTGPITLTLNDQKLNWLSKQESASDTTAVWTNAASTAGVNLKMKTTLEYDGMIRYDLQVTPTDGPVQLKNLLLKIPYQAKLARVRSAHGNVKCKFKDGKAFAFAPMLELGEFETGLNWFSEWDKHWAVSGEPYFEMHENGNTLDCTVRMIGAEGKTVKEPFTITFGLQALPVREVDTTYQHQNRRVYSGMGPMAYKQQHFTDEDLTECSIRYPAEGHVTAEQGTIAARMVPQLRCRALKIGNDEKAVVLNYGSMRFNQYKKAFLISRDANQPSWENSWKGATVIAKLNDLTHASAWVPVALTWKRQGDQTVLRLITSDVREQVLFTTVSIPFDEWQHALSSGPITFGGEGTVGIDHVLMDTHAIPDGEVFRWLNSELSTGTPFALVDPIDEIRLYRGNYMTRPIKSRDGNGGEAGATYLGMLVKHIDGYRGKGLLLPSNEDSDSFDMLYELKIGSIFPIFEQWHTIMGFYGQHYVEHPVQERYYERIRTKKHLSPMMYANFGLNPDDELIGPFIDEVSKKPTGMVYTAMHPNFGTPATDYYVWGWKKTMDHYGVRNLHMDNTLTVRRPCNDVFTNHGFYDEDGNLHGRWHLFASREMAKRFRWLFHIYRKERWGEKGMLCLGHGARRYPMISGFVDLHQSGEGGMFYHSTWEELSLPEEYSDGTAYRYGVPLETLTKPGSQHKFGPNFVMMYMLMFNGSQRTYNFHLNPGSWYVRDDASNQSYLTWGEYNPYFARSGTGWVAAPLGLWWMLQDEFGMEEATFHPFWRNPSTHQVAPDNIRSSLWLRKGEAALFAVCNFGKESVDTALMLNLEELGLSGQNLCVYDAFLYEDYPLNQNVVRLTIPSKSFRLIRVEEH